MKTPKDASAASYDYASRVLTRPADGVQPDIATVIISIKGGIMSSDVTLAAADSKSKADAVRHTITLSAGC